MSNIIISPESGILEFNNNSPSGAAIGSATAPIRLDATGGNSFITGSNFGIGTSQPQFTLDVDGSIHGTSGNFQTAITVGGNPVMTGASPEADTLQTVTNRGATTTNTIRIESTDFASLVLDRGGSNASIVQFENDNGIVGGIGGYNNDGLIFRSKDGNQMALNASNNFGIGTIDPIQKLHVKGIGCIEDASSTDFGTLQFGTNTLRYIRGNSAELQVGATIQQLHFQKTNGPAQVASSAANGVTAIQLLARNVHTSANLLEVVNGNGQAADFVIDSDGKVGIGTTGPSDELEVYKNGSDVAIRIHEDAGTHEARLHLRRGGNDWEIINNSDLAFEIEGSEIVRFKTNGNVGIGTTNPSQKLHLVDTNGSIIILNSNTANENNGIFMTEAAAASPYTKGAYVHYDGTNESFKINTGDSTLSTRFTILRDTGNVGIGTTNPSQLLHLFSSTTNPTGIGLQNSQRYYSVRSNNFSLVFTDETVGSERMRINSSGNVGIGTTNPQQILHLNTPEATIQFQSTYGKTSYINQGGGNFHIKAAHSSGVAINYGESNTALLNLYNNTTAAVSLRANGISYFNGGNVGIGTTSPNSFGFLETAVQISAGSSSSTTLQQAGLVLSGSSDADDADDFAYLAFTNHQSTLSNGRVAEIRALKNGTNVDTGELAFYTILQERMRIDHDGNVGIGTNSPNAKLHVNHASDAGTYARFSRGTTNIDFDLGAEYAEIISTIKEFRVGTSDAQSFHLVSNDHNRITIDSSGYVGIGTTSPDALLDVSITSGNAWMNLINGSETNFRLTTYNNGTGNGSNAYAFKHGLYYSTTENAAVTFYRGGGSTGGFLTFTTNDGSERMRIDSSGNVGIGTTSPAGKLDVRGGMSVFETTLTNNDDWQNSPISILERDNVGSTQSADKYSPNLNFHWSARVSNSLWMNSSGHLNWGSFGSTGIPNAIGVFQTNTINLIGTGRITGVDTVTDSTDAANKAYVDAQVGSADTLQEVTDNGNTFSADLLYTNSGTAQKIDNNDYNGLMHFNASRNVGFHASTANVAHIHSYSETHFKFGSSHNSANTTAMIVKSDGTVGIGTTGPTSPLTIKSNSVSASDSALTIQGNSNTNAIVKIAEKSTDGARFHMYDGGVEKIAFYTDGTANHISAGNVGIGTTSPDSRLDVTGGDITVNTSAAGFMNFKYGSVGSETSRGTITTDGIDLRINATADLVFQPTGNVGIGTTDPSQKLSVAGSIDAITAMGVAGQWASSQIRLETTDTVDTTGWQGISFDSSTAPNYGWSIGVNRSGSGRGSFRFYEHVNSATGSERFTILQDGNVGIGTTSPSAALTVEGSANDSTFRLDSFSGSGYIDALMGNTPYFRLYQSNGNRLQIGPGDGNINRFNSSNTALDLSFATNGGNVGIGTTSPSAKLHVNHAGDTGTYARLSRGTTNIDFDLGAAYAEITSTIKQFRVGTSDAQSFHLVSNDSNAMTIDTSQNVGIGTTTPDEFSIGNAYRYLAVGGDKPAILNLIDDGTNGSYLQFGTAAGLRRSSIHTLNGSHLVFAVNNSNSGVNLTEAMRIAADGNVGIGTTNPTTKLHVSGNALIDPTANGVTLTLGRYSGQPSIKAGTDDGGYLIMDSSSNYLSLNHYVNKDVILANGGGDVGIGTNDPIANLHVDGDVQIGSNTNPNSFGALQVNQASNVDEAGIGVLSASAGRSIRIWVDESRSYINSGNGGGGILVLNEGVGNVGIGTTSPDSKLHVANGNVELTDGYGLRWGDNSVGIYGNAANETISVYTSASEKVRITSAGNVGIGDTTPSYKLDVNGTLRATSAAYFNNDVVVTNNLALTGANKPTFTTPDDTVYTPSYNWVTATPFNAAWHDLIAFNRNYTTSQEISTDGTNFSSDTLELGLFDQKDKTKYEVVGNGERAVRWTWTGVAYNVGRYFHIAAGYSSPTPSCTVKIETSSDGSTWTEIHSSSGVSFSASNRFYYANPYIGNGGHNYVRLTIDKGNTDTKTINLTSIKMLTQRLGDQGQGREDELPFYYDKNQNIGIGTTTPTAKLHIDDNATAGTGLLVTGGGQGGPLATFTRDVGASATIAINASSALPQIRLAASSNTFALGVNGSTFEIADNTSLGTNARLSITNTGNVGIGTTNPSKTLHVNGELKTANNITCDGTTIFGGTSSLDINLFAAGSLTLKTNNTAALTIDSSQNVGIGTTTPASKLHVDGTVQVGVNDTGYDVKFYGDDSGEYMEWDASNARLNIIHTDEIAGLQLFTNAAAQTTQPQIKIGRSNNQYWGAYVDDRNAHLVHRQDETSGNMTTRFDQWDSNTSDNNGSWLWRVGNGSGASMATAMTLTQAGDLTLGGSLTLGGTGRIQGIDTVTASTDAANKAYVDAQVGSADTLQEVTDNGATTTNNISIGTTSTFTAGGTAKLSVNGIISWGISSSDLSYFRRLSAGNFQWQTYNGGNSGNIHLQPYGGNVGIGLTNPSIKLEVNSAGTDEVARFQSTDNDSYISISDNTDAVYIGHDAALDVMSLGFSSSMGVSSNVNIDTDGHVGIGTNNPSHQLEIGLTSSVSLANQPAEPLHVSNNGQSVDGRVFISVKHDKINTASAIGAGLKMTAGAVTSGTASYFDSLIYLESAGPGSDTIHSAPKAIKFYVDNHATNAGSGTNYNDLGDLALTISEDAKVGIGTTSPAQKLEVAGSAQITTNNPQLVFNDNTGSTYTSSWMYENNIMKYVWGGGKKFSISSDGGITIGQTYSSSHTAPSKGMIMEGNLGIGTNNPSTASLYIEDQGVNWNEATPGASIGTIHLDPVGDGATSTGNAITFGASDTGNGGSAQAGIYIRSDGSYGTKMYLATTDSYASGSKTRLMINHNGNVGIGTTNPSQKLHIHNGGIYATPVAYAGGADEWLLKTGAYNNSGWDHGGIKVRVSSGGQPRLSLMSFGSAETLSLYAGNVGIGIGNPSYKLHVSGTVGLTSSLYFTNNTAYIQTGSSWGNGVLNFLNGSTTAITFDVPNNRIQNNLGKYLTASSGTGEFGTLDNQSVAIVANNSTKMTILSGGNVGIGTTSPTQKLDIGAGHIRLDAGYSLQWDNSHERIEQSDGHLEFFVNNTESMTLDTNGLGIGTTGPKGKLHVLDGTAGSYSPDSEADTVVIESSVAGGISLIGTGSSSERKQKIVFGTTGDTTGAVVLYDPNNSFMSIGPTAASNFLKLLTGNGTEAMRLAADGNVGIGVTNPNAKLKVNGAIVSQGGSYSSAVDTFTDVGLVMTRGDYLYSDNGDYLRKLIGHTSANALEIGQSGTALITDINLRPGTSGNISFFASGSEDVRINSSGNVGIGTTNPY
jgi:hypothetical protein